MEQRAERDEGGDYFLFRIVMLYGCPVADMALHVGQQLRTSTCPWLPNSLSHAYTPPSTRLSRCCPASHQALYHTHLHHPFAAICTRKTKRISAHAKVIKKQWMNVRRDGGREEGNGATWERVCLQLWICLSQLTWRCKSVDFLDSLSLSLWTWISFVPLETWLSYDTESELQRVY